MKPRIGEMPVLVVTHLPDPELGLVEDALGERGIATLHRNLLRDRQLTDVPAIAAIVSLGGQMSVTNLSAFPFLAGELKLMRSALLTGVPIFGLCLGAQLLAVAAGGRVSRMPRRYIGWPDLALTPAAREDILFRNCPRGIPVIKWHADAIELPSTVTVLATTASPGCAVFRAGPCAWGSQMHLEATPEMLFDRWLTDPAEHGALLEAGMDPKAFASQCRQRLPDQVIAMRPVFSRFADYIGRHRAGSGT